MIKIFLHLEYSRWQLHFFYEIHDKYLKFNQESKNISHKPNHVMPNIWKCHIWGLIFFELNLLSFFPTKLTQQMGLSKNVIVMKYSFKPDGIH